jgi:hypothetical protein
MNVFHVAGGPGPGFPATGRHQRLRVRLSLRKAAWNSPTPTRSTGNPGDTPKVCSLHRTNWAFAFSGTDLFCRSWIVFRCLAGNKVRRALLHSLRSEGRPTLNAHIQTQMEEPCWQQLALENGSLRAIIAELLIKNQNLRWQLQGRGSRPSQDPGVLTAPEGTPLRRKPSTAGIP